jgi:hypothetical protein
VRELHSIEAKYILFTDDHFAADINRVEEICDLILQDNVQKIYGVALRIEVAFHEEVLKKMFKAGFRFLSLGIESTKDKTLLEMGKGFDTTKVREACKLLREHPFILVGYFLIENIGENEKDMLKITDFSNELGLDFIYPSYLKTEKHSQFEELLGRSSVYYTDKKGFICSKMYSRDHLKSIRRRIHKRFYTITKSVFNNENDKININEVFSCDVINLDADVFYLSKGRYQNTEKIKKFDNGIIVGSLFESIKKYPEIFKKHFSKYANYKKDGIIALNTALFKDGLFIYVPEKAKTEKPIQLINLLLNNEKEFSNIRNLFIIEKNAQAEIIFCNDSLTANKFLTNSLTEIYVGENANLNYSKIQNDHNESANVSTTFIHQAKNSNV